MTRRALIAIPLLLAACAPAGTIPAARTDRATVTLQTNDGTTDVQMTREAAITSEVFTSDGAAVWRALPQAYAKLGIEVTGVDTDAKLLTAVQRVRRVGGRRVADFFNCPGPYGNLASSGDVFLTMRSQVLPAGGEVTTVRHEVDAFARSSTGSISTSRCRSNGELEKLINATIEAQLGGA